MSKIKESLEKELDERSQLIMNIRAPKNLAP